MGEEKIKPNIDPMAVLNHKINTLRNDNETIKRRLLDLTKFMEICNNKMDSLGRSNETARELHSMVESIRGMSKCVERLKDTIGRMKNG